MKISILFATMFFLSLAHVTPQVNDRDLVREERVVKRTPVPLPLIGSEAPSFTAQSTNGKIDFPADFGNKWKMIFAHPNDFTPVCSSELLELAYKQDDFDNLGVELIVLSYDDLLTHKNWKAALESISYKNRNPVDIKFPLVEDSDFQISNKYGMVPVGDIVGPNIRSVFIIDPENKVRSILHYPNEVGRNIDELHRTLVALQKTYKNDDIATPANWNQGDDVIVTVLSRSELESIGKPDSGLYQYSWFMTFKKME